MQRFSLVLVALALFLLPSSVSAQPGFAGHEEDGFFIETDDESFKLSISHFTQLRYFFDRQETDDRDQPFNGSAFELRRARLILKGHAFNPNLFGFSMQLAFDRGVFSLKDLTLELRPTGGLEISLGQFKRPFGRQFLTSGSAQEFLERAITHDAFGSGRDIGLLIHNDYKTSPTVEWALGVNNGKADELGVEGETPEHAAPELIARLGYNYGGILGYKEEADQSRGPLRLALGGSAFARFDQDNDDRSTVQAQLDGTLKLRGLSTTAAFYASWAQRGASFSEQEAEAKGFHLQLGYMLSETIQPVLRYAIVSPEGPDNDVQEFGLAFNAYFFAHKLKWQSDFVTIVTDDLLGARNRFLARTQMQWQW